MKRKVASVFGKSRDRLKPPYLTPEERNEFHTEFTLFGDTVDLKKLQGTIANKKDKLCTEFVSELLLKYSKMSFDNYLQAIDKKINEKQPSERCQILFALLDEEGKGEITPHSLVKIMQETGDQKLSEQDATEILHSIFGNHCGKLTKELFGQILLQKIPDN